MKKLPNGLKIDADLRDEISILESRFWKNMNLDIQLIDYSKLK